MADTPTFQSNPYGSFDPSQWSNPYSNFYGKALPWPSSYAGTPTNALGQPIAQPQGMTLNQTPAQPQAPAAAAPGGGAGGWFQIAPGVMGYGSPQTANQGRLMQTSAGGQVSGGAASVNAGLQGGQNIPAQYQFMPQQQQQQAPMAAAPTAPNNWQNTLSMLANPGHVTTPGATVPAAAPGGGQPSPGVLQNFLANWQPASSGPGSGFTQNFNTILRGLQAKGS